MLRHRLRLIVVMLVLFGLLSSGLRWLTNSQPAPDTQTATFGLINLAATASDFPEPGDDPPDWPRDHGAKRDQFAEYWLFSGLLADSDGRQYGFQLALFRVALQTDEPFRDSAWATRDMYLAHLVVTAAGATPHMGERYSRAALGLSGDDYEPIRIWLENWQVEYDQKAMVFQLDATDADYGLALRLVPPADEPLVIDGADYRGYWWPGLMAEGELTVAGRKIGVSGRALLDRLWGRALPVGRGQLALNRLWLELDDGSALRCHQLRRRVGGGTPLGECLLRRPDGSSERFVRDRVTLEPVEDGWRDLGGVRYPLSWRLQLADYGPEIQISPLADEREQFASPMWSGTVQVRGRPPGWGLLELSNYAGP